MKKILSFAALLICIFFSAQQTNFSGNYSTAKLKELRKDVPANARHDFYVQYFKAKIFEDMKLKFKYKKYDDQVLKSFTDSIFSNYHNIEIKTNVDILNDLDKEFKKGSNSDELSSLLEQNLNLYPYVLFPNVSPELDEPAIYETIPGTILSYYYTQQSGDSTYTPSYIIVGKKIKLINVYPDDNTFVKKVSKYAKTNWRFEERAGYDISKNINGEYLISSQINTDGESYLIEYKTRDFENFVPLRIAINDDKPVWKVIK